MVYLENRNVEVYFNLHRKCFSVRARDGADRGKVIAHVRGIVLRDVAFKVSEAGRQRVLRERRKNVHATVRGVVTSGGTVRRSMRGVTYNPFVAGHFTERATGARVDNAAWCGMHLTHDRHARIYVDA